MTHPTWQAVLGSSGHPFQAELQKNRQFPSSKSRGGGPLQTSLESNLSALGEKMMSPMLSQWLRLLDLATLMSESPQKRQWGGWDLMRRAPLLEFWQEGKTGPSFCQLFLSKGLVDLAKLSRMEDPLQAVYIIQQCWSSGLQTKRGSSVPQLSSSVEGPKATLSSVTAENLPSPWSREKVRMLALLAAPPQKMHLSQLYSQF